MFYALVDIVVRFFDTDLSVLMRLSVIEFLTERTCHSCSCNTLKTSKLKDIIILVKRDQFTPYSYHRLQRINAG